jgi:DNA polymerase-3 subunit delta'
MLNSSQHFPTEIFPWQQEPWRQIWVSKEKNRLAHALLLIGVDGLGKSQFARALAGAVLCSQSSDQGVRCGVCHGCCMVTAKSHPDLMIIEPEETGKKIGVDQIRDVIKNVNETTLKGGFRVIVIHPATAMNVNAANALLKTLEEPTPNTLLILVSNQGLRLPATIISRCQKVMFAKPSTADALSWLKPQINDDKIDLQLLLKLADGAPLKALALQKNDLLSLRRELYQEFNLLSCGQADPLQVASKCQDRDHLTVVDLLLSWLTDLIRFKLTQDPANLMNADYKAEITKMSLALLQSNLLAYVDHLQQARTDLASSINLNKQLLFENIFIRWVAYVSC